MTNYKPGQLVEIVGGSSLSDNKVNIGCKTRLRERLIAQSGRYKGEPVWVVEGGLNQRSSNVFHESDIKPWEKTMTLFEIIDNACRHGCYPVISGGGGFVIISPHKNEYGYWRESLARLNIEAASKQLGWSVGTREDVWNQREREGWKFHSYYTPPFEHYKKGDLVDVLENARNIPGFDDWLPPNREMVGQKGLEVKGSLGAEYRIYTKDKRTWYYFPHHALAPHIPEEPTEAVVKLENGKTYKVRVLEEVGG